MPSNAELQSRAKTNVQIITRMFEEVAKAGNVYVEVETNG